MSMVTQDSILARHDDLIDSVAQLTLIEVIAATPIQDSEPIPEDEHIIDSYIF
jgi:hypothetical protein